MNTQFKKKEFSVAFSFINEVVNFLRKNENQLYTAREIVENIVENFPNACNEKMKNSKGNYLKTKNDCIQQWVAEISAHKDSWQKKGILMTAGRPRKYYFANNEQTAESCLKTKKNNQPEKELYPILAKFCDSINIKTLRIDEKESKKDKGKNYNKWLHADVVGFKDLISDFNKQTKECLIEYADERSYLYSFEVKDGTIETWNLREYFFQTVSNSSWANYSYLVAEDVNDKAMDELQLLCSSFNIGYIQLNREEPKESQIVIKAPKTSLDWNMINRIANENKDFQKYLDNITLVYQGHSNDKTQKPSWDID